MKPLVIAGVILAALGAFIVFRGVTFGSQRDVVKVGDVHVSAEEQHVIPVWVGGVGIVAGVVLIGVGLRSGRGA